MSGRTALISRECACPPATTLEPLLVLATCPVSVRAVQGIQSQSDLPCSQELVTQQVPFLLDLPSFGSTHAWFSSLSSPVCTVLQPSSLSVTCELGGGIESGEPSVSLSRPESPATCPAGLSAFTCPQPETNEPPF